MMGKSYYYSSKSVTTTAAATTTSSVSSSNNVVVGFLLLLLATTTPTGHAFISTDLPFLNVGGVSGVAVLDYDNDGFDDILIAKGNSIEAGMTPAVERNSGLFRNDGNGGFEDKTVEAGLGMIVVVQPGATDDWVSVISADFNNDGWADAFITSSCNKEECVMHENLGVVDGVHQGFRQHFFTGQNECPTTTYGAAAADIDNNGFVDLFMTMMVVQDNDTPSSPLTTATYINHGNFVFERVVASGTEGVRGQYPCDAAFSDFDDDGDQDLVVLGCKSVIVPSGREEEEDHDGGTSNTRRLLQGTNKFSMADLILYRNNLIGGDFDDAMFTDQTEDILGSRLKGLWMGTAFGDPNRDGLLDLYVGSAGVHHEPIKMIAPHALLLNNGNGTYTDKAYEYGVATTPFNWGSTFFDVDNDGFCDLATTGTGTHLELIRRLHHATKGELSVFNPGTMFYNNGGNSFSITESMGFDESVSSGLVNGDFNNDGRADLVIIRNQFDFWRGQRGDNSKKGLPLLLTNDDNNDNNWIKVKVVGVTSNTSGIGAKVTVVARSRSEKFIQAQQVSAGSSFASTNSHVLIFGLGRAHARRVNIQWPNGGVTEMYRVPAYTDGGVTLELMEGEGRRSRRLA